jgi:hypothetical protein
MKKPVMERVNGFVHKKPAPVKRGGPSYDATYNWAHRKLTALAEEYRALGIEDQTARLTRDDIEFTLRRYQNYCIKENIGAHYYEQGLVHGTKTEFEHIIPAAVGRDLLLFNRLTVDEVLNIPTCRLSAAKHKKLNSTKMGSTTPDVGWFWKRYENLGVSIETHDGTAVDMTTWNLDAHFQYFKVL